RAGRNRAGPGRAPRRRGRVPAGRGRAGPVRTGRGRRRHAAGPPRPRGRPRPGAGAPGAGDRRGWRAQPPLRRPARDGEDDARPAPARPAPATRAGRGARGHPHPLGRRPARAGAPARPRPAVPRAAPQRLDGRDRRGREDGAAGRGEPRAPRRPAPGRASGVHAARPGGSATAARGRRGQRRPRRGEGGLPGPLPAGRDDEPLSLRGARGSRGRVLVLAAAARVLPGQTLEGAPRPLRPGRHGAAPAGRGARRRPLRGDRGGRGAGWSGARAARRARAAADGRGGRAALACGRAGAALRPGPGPRRARRPDGRGARRIGERQARARRRVARVPLAARAGADVSGLPLAAFAAETGGHVLAARRDPRYPRFRDRFDEQAYRSRLAETGVRWLDAADPEFPSALRAIFDPPVGLFLRGGGAAALLERAAVALVGARACSGYGAHVARTFGRELAAAGLTIVSGMARGVDGEAHRGALDAGGTTVAVLGCGVDRDYPAAHAELARRICRDGLVVSEYAPGVEPAPWRFPARNRIVAGLAQATVVVEARERSGALITADLALEEGREVFAVPGEITS